jgi:hypothetical protein
VREVTVLSSHIVTVIFNQLNIKNKIEKDNFEENHKKKTLPRNTIAINNVLNKKNYKTKFSISSI